VESETFRCDRCGNTTPLRQLKEVFEEGGKDRRRLRVCPECLDELMNQADEVEGMPGEEKRAAVKLKEEAQTVEATGARPATTTSSAVEQRSEQASIAPQEGTFTTEGPRETETLPADEQSSETSPARARVRPAPGLEDDIAAEENRDERSSA
jgi:hypothetical protein